MPIKSYLAHPYSGQKEALIKALSAIAECEVLPSQNKEVIVLVTDTENEAQETELKEKLEVIESLKLLALVSGFNSPINN